MTKGKALTSALARYHRRHISVPRAERIVNAAVELLQPFAGGSLLDVGCGDGEIAQRVAERLGARSVRGVDVMLRDRCAITVDRYDGAHLPYGDNAFDAVLLSDVLHHAVEPQLLLDECVRVVRGALLIKDHFRYGVLSHSLLWLMDVAGNAEAGVAVTGRYFSPQQWVEMVAQAGARVADLRWPLVIHDRPWRWVTWSELQFAALVLPLDTGHAEAAAHSASASPTPKA